MQGGYGNCAERFVQHRPAADALQPTLLRRFRFQARLRPNVRPRQEKDHTEITACCYT
jgi:hypothetical protein